MSQDFHLIQMEGPAKNALGTTMMRFLLREVDRAGSRPILLTGEGESFSAGLDLKEVAGLDRASMGAFLALLEQLVVRLFQHPAPTAAAVNGHAIAGGCVLVQCCDLRVGTTSARARIGLNEVAIGLRFPPRTLRAMAHRIPARHREAVLLGAALHPPEEALRLGLLDLLADDPLAEATRRLEGLARHPPAAYAATKADLRGAVTRVPESEVQAYMEEVLPMWTSPEVRERLAGLLERKAR